MRIAVFDLDGTLVDSAPDLHAALDRLMATLDLPGFSRAEVTAMIGDGVKVLVTRALAARGRPFDPEALARFEADYTRHAATLTRPFAGMAAVLEALAGAGWALAVCTNKPLAATHALLASLGWTGRFQAVAGGDSFPVRKPDPAHLLGTLALLPQGPAAMIGDHRNDMAAAVGAGIPAIFAGWGYGQPGMEAGAAAVAGDPSQLPALLRDILG